MHSDTLFSQLGRLGAESTGDMSRQQGGAGCRVAGMCHTKAKASLGVGGDTDLFSAPGLSLTAA